MYAIMVYYRFGGSIMPTAKNNKNTQKKPVKKVEKKIENPLMDEVVILSSLAICVILFLSNFGWAGSFGKLTASFMFGMFGVIEYIMPVIIFLVVLFALSNKQNNIAKIKLIAVVITLMLVCTFCQLLCIKAVPFKSEVAAIYTYSSKHHLGGGLTGALFFKIFSLFGIVGSYFLTVIFIIIGLVVITERSFIGGVKDRGKRVYNSAKSDFESLKEVSLEKQEKREQIKEIKKEEKQQKAELKEERKEAKRSDKKVRGVAITNTTIQKEPVNTVNKGELNITKEIVKEDEFAKEIFKVDHQEKPVVIKLEEKEFVKNIDKALKEKLEFDNKAPDMEKRETKKTITKEAEKLVAEKEEPKKEATVTKNAKKQTKNTDTYIYPPIDLLNKNTSSKSGSGSEAELKETAMRLQQVFQNFGVKVTVTDASKGPSVTRYELQPEQGVKVSKIVSLADDIKLNLAVADIRIEAPIPGKAAVGIEVPNTETSSVLLRDLIESDDFKKNPSKIAFAAGKDIGGKPIISDIAKMPHLLIAGATGSGKSVCINTIITSILYKASPSEVKLIMVDPKVVELQVYNGIPHLMVPVVTDPKKAIDALDWAVIEMDKRYKKFAEVGVRDLKAYNERVDSVTEELGEISYEKLPQIVIIIDELADLMMVASSDVESRIIRLAQLARAAGMHLVIATQRPSANVLTGLIKANVPSRISFAVSSGIDSRIILDSLGAEKLLGRGDMLYYPSSFPKPLRVQGTYVSDEEVTRIVEFVKANSKESKYDDSVIEHVVSATMQDSQAFGGDRDQYFAEAGRFIIEKQKASIGMLQRMYKIGFNRAARIMDQLADAGVVGPEEGTKPRKVLMTMEEFEELL